MVIVLDAYKSARLLNLGCYDEKKVEENNLTRLSNSLALLIVFLNISSLPSYWFLGLTELFPFLCVGTCIYASIPIMNKFKLYYQARVTLITMIGIGGWYWCEKLGSQSGVQFLFFIALVFALLFFQSRYRLTSYFFSAICISGFVLVQSGYYDFLADVYIEPETLFWVQHIQLPFIGILFFFAIRKIINLYRSQTEELSKALFWATCDSLTGLMLSLIHI